jgi:hypothetical protein
MDEARFCNPEDGCWYLEEECPDHQPEFIVVGPMVLDLDDTLEPIKYRR